MRYVILVLLHSVAVVCVAQDVTTTERVPTLPPGTIGLVCSARFVDGDDVPALSLVFESSQLRKKTIVFSAPDDPGKKQEKTSQYVITTPRSHTISVSSVNVETLDGKLLDSEAVRVALTQPRTILFGMRPSAQARGLLRDDVILVLLKPNAKPPEFMRTLIPNVTEERLKSASRTLVPPPSRRSDR